MTPPTPDDTARTWRDLADQLTPEQIAILEDYRWGCAHASATPTASPLAISSSIRPSESPPSSLSLAGGGGGDAGDQSSRDAEAVVEAFMHARERYESHTGAALTVGQSRRRP